MMYRDGPPKYCKQCGKHLKREDRSEERYDEYTGLKVTDTCYLYVCEDWSLTGKGDHTKKFYFPSEVRI